MNTLTTAANSKPRKIELIQLHISFVALRFKLKPAFLFHAFISLTYFHFSLQPLYPLPADSLSVSCVRLQQKEERAPPFLPCSGSANARQLHAMQAPQLPCGAKYGAHAELAGLCVCYPANDGGFCSLRMLPQKGQRLFRLRS